MLTSHIRTHAIIASTQLKQALLPGFRWHRLVSHGSSQVVTENDCYLLMAELLASTGIDGGLVTQTFPVGARLLQPTFQRRRLQSNLSAGLGKNCE